MQLEALSVVVSEDRSVWSGVRCNRLGVLFVVVSQDRPVWSGIRRNLKSFVLLCCKTNLFGVESCATYLKSFSLLWVMGPTGLPLPAAAATGLPSAAAAALAAACSCSPRAKHLESRLGSDASRLITWVGKRPTIGLCLFGKSVLAAALPCANSSFRVKVIILYNIYYSSILNSTIVQSNDTDHRYRSYLSMRICSCLFAMLLD